MLYTHALRNTSFIMSVTSAEKRAVNAEHACEYLAVNFIQCIDIEKLMEFEASMGKTCVEFLVPNGKVIEILYKKYEQYGYHVSENLRDKTPGRILCVITWEQ